MRARLDGTRMYRTMFESKNRFALLEKTLTGTETLQDGIPHLLALDPGGAGRTVKLPAGPVSGDFLIIINTADAAEVLTIQDSAGVALTPACTPTQNEIAFVFYVDATLGWRNFVGLGA